MEKVVCCPRHDIRSVAGKTMLRVDLLQWLIVRQGFNSRFATNPTGRLAVAGFRWFWGIGNRFLTLHQAEEIRQRLKEGVIDSDRR